MSAISQEPAARQDRPEIELGSALIDVVIRGLESARRNAGEGDAAEPREFCALLYGTPGTFCPLAYYHRPE